MLLYHFTMLLYHFTRSGGGGDSYIQTEIKAETKEETIVEASLVVGRVDDIIGEVVVALGLGGVHKDVLGPVSEHYHYGNHVNAVTTFRRLLSVLFVCVRSHI